MENKEDYYHLITGAVFVLCAVPYCKYIVPICHHTTQGMFCLMVWVLLAAFLFMVWDKMIVLPEKYLKYFSGAGVVVGWFATLGICFFYDIHYDATRVYNGPALIAKYRITKIEAQRGWYESFGYFKIGRQKYKDDFKYVLKTSGKPKGKWSYSIYLLGDCERPMYCYRLNPKEEDIALIHDFAFMENDSLYSYHDYALKKPDLVYNYVGFYLVYKAKCYWDNASDSIVRMYYHDKNGKWCGLKYKMNRNDVFADTMLVYANVATGYFVDMNFYVCLPELNTPENRAKINNYGYIFHHDIYSKEEIETQCPRIKQYVDDTRPWGGHTALQQRGD